MVTVAELEALIRLKLEGEANARRAQKALDDVEKSAGGLGKTLGTAGKAAAVAGAAIAGGLVVGLGSAVKTAADFQQSLADVGSATGATKDQMAAMRAEALKIGADTSKSASEAVEAMGELVKAGVSTEDVVGGVARTVVQLSEATGSTVASMATLMSDSLNVFNLEATESSNVANTLAQAAAASSIDINDMAQSLASGGLVAKSAGLSIQDFSTAIAIMGNQGLKGSDAGTSLKAVIAGLTPVTDKAKAAFQNLGIQVFDAEGKFRAFPDILASLSTAFSGLTEEQRASTAELIFGSDGIRAFNALVPATASGLEDATTQWAAMTEAQRQQATVAEQSAIRMATLKGQLEALKGSLETIAIEVGSLLLPALTAVVAFLAANVGPAFDALRAKLAGIWANIGPEATAAGQAIVAGLQTAAAWITGTFIPAAQQVAGDIWSGVGPRAQAAAQSIIAGLQGAVSWLNEHGPQMATALVAAFERARSEIGPILSGIVADINASLSQIDTQAIENEVVVSFQNMADAARGVDFSPLVAAFQPLVAEGQKWAAFVQQDFRAAIANLSQGIQAGKAQIDQMLPSWINLENAGRAAALVVVSAAASIVGVITNAMAGVRNALQLVVDVLNNDWSAAFRTALQVALNLAAGIPPVNVAITLVRVAVELLGSALSSAAGFVGGLASGLASLAGTASGVIGPLQSVLGALNAIGGARGALDFIMPGSLPPLAQGFKDTGEQAAGAAGELGTLANAVQDAGQFGTSTLSTWARSTAALVEYSTQLRHANASLRDLGAELRSLKLAQALDPTNEALGEQIKGLTFTINVHRDLAAVLKESIAGWHAETFAIDGFVQSLNTLNTAGPQALKIQEAFIKALTENDFSAGGNLAESIQTMIADATKTLTDAPDLLAPIQALGDQVLAAFQAALTDPSEGTINAAMAMLTNLTSAINDATVARTDQLKAAGTLTAETFAQAFAGEESKAALGSAGVSLMEALADAMNQGGQKAIAKAANLTQGMRDELQKLPEFVRGKLGADFSAAMDSFLANPTQDALDGLRPVIQQINQTLDLIPQNMSDLAPEVVSEIEQIIKAFLDLGLSAEDAGTQIEAALKRAAASAKETKAATQALSAEQEAKLTEHITGLGLPTQLIVPASGGGGGQNAKAEMFAAAVASPGGWTPALAAAFADGMEQIATGMAEETKLFDQILATLERSSLSAELERFAAWVAQFGDQWLKVILETKGAAAAFEAYHGRTSASVPMTGPAPASAPITVVLQVDGREFARAMAPMMSGEFATSIQGTAGGSY
jgi:TP901 family phage tail tape measure protein